MFPFFPSIFFRAGGFVVVDQFNHIFISFASVQIYDLSYVHVYIISFLIIPALQTPFLVLDENSLVKNVKTKYVSTADIKRSF